MEKKEIKKQKEVSPKPIYIFDFDETLVTDVGKVYIVDKDNNRRAITHTTYHHKDLKDGESFDLSDFDVVTKPKIHHNMMNLLKKHLKDSVILTARMYAQPVRDFMDSIGIKVPRIIAVAKDHDYHANAKRKAKWIENEILTNGYNYIEFWDDNELNMQETRKLIKKYPGTKFVLHLVKKQLI